MPSSCDCRSSRISLIFSAGWDGGLWILCRVSYFALRVLLKVESGEVDGVYTSWWLGSMSLTNILWGVQVLAGFFSSTIAGGGLCISSIRATIVVW